MRFITNYPKKDIEKHLADLKRKYPDRKFIAAEPQSFGKYTWQEIESSGYVGLYEVPA